MEEDLLLLNEGVDGVSDSWDDVVEWFLSWWITKGGWIVLSFIQEVMVLWDEVGCCGILCSSCTDEVDTVMIHLGMC